MSLKLLRTSKTGSQNGSLCQRINVKNIQAHAMQKRKASRCIETKKQAEKKKTQTPFRFSKALNCSTATKDPSYKLRNCTSTLAPKGCSNFAPLKKKQGHHEKLWETLEIALKDLHLEAMSSVPSSLSFS